MKDIKFDKLGNFYLLDFKDRVYAKNSRTKVTLENILDFEVTATGDILAISKLTSGVTFNTWQDTNGQRNKLFSSQNFTQIAVNNNVPVFVDDKSRVINYGF